MSGSTDFTKEELRVIRETLAPLLVPPARPLTAEQLVKVGAVLERVDHVIENTRTAPERGELVLRWEVPGALALTMNAYAGSRGWKKHKDRKALDGMLRAILPAFPKALLHGAEKRRWVRATRFSPRRVDEIALDVLGAKTPLDLLVKADILHDDNDAFLIREPRWEKTKPGTTRLLVEVFEVATEGVATPEPECSPVPFERTFGPMTNAIVGGR